MWAVSAIPFCIPCTQKRSRRVADGIEYVAIRQQNRYESVEMKDFFVIKHYLTIFSKTFELLRMFYLQTSVRMDKNIENLKRNGGWLQNQISIANKTVWNCTWLQDFANKFPPGLDKTEFNSANFKFQFHNCQSIYNKKLMVVNKFSLHT